MIQEIAREVRDVIGALAKILAGEREEARFPRLQHAPDGFRGAHFGALQLLFKRGRRLEIVEHHLVHAEDLGQLGVGLLLHLARGLAELLARLGARFFDPRQLERDLLLPDVQRGGGVIRRRRQPGRGPRRARARRRDRRIFARGGEWDSVTSQPP